MTKLPVWATVTEAYRTLWVHRWPLLRFAAVPFVLVISVDALGTLFMAGAGISAPDGEPDGWSFSLGPVDLLAEILGEVIIIAFVVPCYRLLLLGPAAVRVSRGSWPARRAYLGMLGLTVLLTALLYGPLMALDYVSATGDGQIWPLLVILHIAVFLWLVVRLAFLYPAICLGDPWQLSKRWRETAGSFWRLLGAYLLALLPLLMAVMLWAASFVVWWDETSGPLASPLESLLVALVWFAAEAFLAAVTVVAFAVLTGYPAKGVRIPPGVGGAGD
jgi:hypothetical protein